MSCDTGAAAGAAGVATSAGGTAGPVAAAGAAARPDLTAACGEAGCGGEAGGTSLSPAAGAACARLVRAASVLHVDPCRPPITNQAPAPIAAIRAAETTAERLMVR